MATLKENIKDAGESIGDSAKEVGHKIADGAQKAMDWAKEKTGMGASNQSADNVREGMDVIASCGKKVGVVDRVEGGAIKLTRKDSTDNQHHFIPSAWVERVDGHVHLSKNSMETEQSWKSDAASCGC